ncbi:DUF2063 domain-containing protein [Alteromonas sp. H39]|uniref:HvfC family RiPP maturation protein n=1 Tax=Alteromonas sp. H39 TaxID=3389876 RepID=UPI0039E11BA6
MKSFQATQRQFTQAIRNPESATPANPDEARRLAVYQSLFFNNILNFLQSGFPVIFDILSEKQSETLARQFFAQHHCRSPYFAQISQEFVEFLSSGPKCLSDYPDWLPELAHYEWLELDVSIRKTPTPVAFWDRDEVPETVCVSPLASLVSYIYPVHLLGPDFLTPEINEHRHYYVVYRNRDEDVAFMVVNPLTAMLVNMAEESISVSDIVTGLREQVPSLSPQQVESGAFKTISEMLDSGILIAGE